MGTIFVAFVKGLTFPRLLPHHHGHQVTNHSETSIVHFSYSPKTKKPSAIMSLFKNLIKASDIELDETLGQDDRATPSTIEAIKCKLMAVSGGTMSDERLRFKVGVYEKCIKAVHKYFPGSMSSANVLNKVIQVLEKIGCTSSNTLFGQSVCPDEINHDDGDITDLMSIHLGEVFHLGGLAGVPFTGKTGFGAYAGHVRTHTLTPLTKTDILIH